MEDGEIVRNMDRERILMLKATDLLVNMMMDYQMGMVNIIGLMVVFTEAVSKRGTNRAKELCLGNICKIKVKNGYCMKESLLMMQDMEWEKLNGLMEITI